MLLWPGPRYGMVAKVSAAAGANLLRVVHYEDISDSSARELTAYRIALSWGHPITETWKGSHMTQGVTFADGHDGDAGVPSPWSY